MTTNILTAIVTAYVATGQPCADGKYPKVNQTIALPRAYPLGSTVIIQGRRYLGQDRTARRFNGRFDIFVADRTTALNWGRRKLTVTVITP
jgi:3D (Asp-Asp-Asp) domain-containing protein